MCGGVLVLVWCEVVIGIPERIREKPAVDELVKAKADGRVDLAAIAIAAGTLTFNEARRMYGLSDRQEAEAIRQAAMRRPPAELHTNGAARENAEWFAHKAHQGRRI
jgi:hypothetical protein